MGSSQGEGEKEWRGAWQGLRDAVRGILGEKGRKRAHLDQVFLEGEREYLDQDFLQGGKWLGGRREDRR